MRRARPTRKVTDGSYRQPKRKKTGRLQLSFRPFLARCPTPPPPIPELWPIVFYLLSSVPLLTVRYYLTSPPCSLSSFKVTTTPSSCPIHLYPIIYHYHNGTLLTHTQPSPARRHENHELNDLRRRKAAYRAEKSRRGGDIWLHCN